MLTRLTPLRSRRPTPRREPDAACSRQGCLRPPRYLRLCKSHAIEVADELFSKLIRRRDRSCQVCGSAARLDCAHLRPRTKFATRWEPLNAVALCFLHHLDFTLSPLEWDEWCAARLGADVWELLVLRSNLGGMPDLAQVIPALRRRLEEAS